MQPRPFLTDLDEIFAVAATPDSKYIVSGAYDQSIKVFDIQTKQEIHHFKNAHPGIFL